MNSECKHNFQREDCDARCSDSKIQEACLCKAVRLLSSHNYKQVLLVSKNWRCKSFAISFDEIPALSLSETSPHDEGEGKNVDFCGLQYTP